MSRIRADKFVNNDATRAPELSLGAEVPVGYGITGAGGINIAGVATAASFSGNLTGTATGLSGTPDITIRNIVGVGATFSGTLNYEDVTNIDSVGLVTARAGVKVLGAGVTAAGVSTFHNDLHVAGVVEKVAAATTYQHGNDMVLELDVTNSTTYRYQMPNAGNIGIVSFKNMPADRENGTTVTVLFTQKSSTPTGGIGNTQAINGIGTHCTVVPYAGGSALAGITTAGLVGSASTVTLSGTASDVDFVSFFVHYNGGTNTNLTSYKVYVTSNGNFRFGVVGI
tara:strand:- start:31 stop:879 length:849 start_codon:yes stop_codon:yes gene_type:complete